MTQLLVPAYFIPFSLLLLQILKSSRSDFFFIELVMLVAMLALMKFLLSFLSTKLAPSREVVFIFSMCGGL